MQSVKQLSTITGIVDRFIFHNAQEEFVVFMLIVGTETITARGRLTNLQVGQEVKLRGEWVFHKKFGKQFDVTECVYTLPTTVVGLKKYLGSGLIKGIGKNYADKLVNYFGISILTVIDTMPHRLQEVEGIGSKRAETIAAAWREQKDIANIMMFLQEKGISPAIATKIYKHYKHEAIPLLQQNPYRIADEIWGIGFKTADEIAQKLGISYDHPQRIEAGILFILSTASAQGHLYEKVDSLKGKVISLLSLSQENQEHIAHVKNALHQLYTTEKIKLITHENEHYLGTTRHYLNERGVARLLKNLLFNQPSLHIDEKTINDLLHTEQPLTLNDDQLRGIFTCLQHKVTIITGGPGTGKTTLIRRLITLLNSLKARYKLAAPTGRATKRMSESSGTPASTIHRLLEFDVATMSFTYNEKNPLMIDFLIIDEASMIDIFLAHAILKAVPPTARIVFIGDIHQLPSVGPGNFLADCLSTQSIAHVHLTHIFRQAQNSLIIVNAHRINKGEFPLHGLPGVKKDFIFIKEDEPAHLPQHLKKILFSDLTHYNITPQETVILTPMNKGAAGTHALNYHLQSLLNPEPQPSIMHTGCTYKVNDKVMQIRNNYEKCIFNGDIGIIEDIIPDDRTFFVNFAERQVEYSFDELHELVLAYAITIHKSQGSEYPAVVIPLFMQHYTLLQRNLVYTALTRAKQACIIIGQPKALALAIGNAHLIRRITFLHKFLHED
jgi:exodeoxyribonuclease V alpha subunit